MKHALLALLASAGAAVAGDKLVQEISFAQLAAAGQLKAGTVLADPETLRITNSGGPLHAHLFDLAKPQIATPFYRIEGEVRYDTVQGTGYLEMWNHFAGGGSFFSRTLGDGGPLGSLRGTTTRRPFSLPFNATGAHGAPERLEVNLQLPGEGTVYLRGLKLIEMSSFAIGGAAPGAWWSDRAAGWVGGIGGAVLGCLGTFLEWSAARGRARRFVLAASRTLLVLGIASLTAGLIAIALRQPYGVWYVLLLCGLICTAVFAVRLRQYQARYRELELRRMSALDAV
jgi:hypothetical protein